MNPLNTWVYTGGVEPSVLEGMTANPWAARTKWLQTILGDINKQAGNMYQSILGSLAAAGGEGSGPTLTGEAAIKQASQDAYEKARASSALDIMRMLRQEDLQKQEWAREDKRYKDLNKYSWLQLLSGLGKAGMTVFG